jgi:hypothetical protein
VSKLESILVGAAIGVLCPFLVFILFWWTTAVLAIYGILRVSERGIATAAFTGLALGLFLDAVWLKRWIARCYRASLRLLLALYLACSAVAVASFMGLPAGNLALGTLAGVYVGRRAHHAAFDRAAFARLIRRTGLFTAAVTGIEALAIGLLALREESVGHALQAGLGMNESAIVGLKGVGLVVTLSLALAIFQFWCTRAAARLAFGRGRAEGIATED